MTNPVVVRAGQKNARPRLWAPRMWEGCNLFAWLRLLWRGRFAVHWTCWHIALVITLVSSWHTAMRLIQEAFYGHRIRRTVLRHPPIFILGHWRTGTTLLHELMVQDERHAFPTTYQCMDPNHFLLTEGFSRFWLHWLMPTRRPMDNMAAGFDRPQEDEFALCMLGELSPYLTIAFPNQGPQYADYLDLHGLSPALACCQLGSELCTSFCKKSPSATQTGWCSNRRRTPPGSRCFTTCFPRRFSFTSSAILLWCSPPR